MTSSTTIARTVTLIALSLLLITDLHAQEDDTWAWRGGNIDDSAVREAINENAPELASYDVLMLLVDGLPSRRLACYGAEQSLTPTIDELCRDAFVFDNAFSVSPHRLTSLLSIITSQYATTIEGLGDMTKSETIATMFRDRGYRCYLGLHPSVLELNGEPVGDLSDSLGFDRRAWSRARTKEPYAEMVADHLATRRLGEPLLGVIHYLHAYPPARFHPGIEYGNNPEAQLRSALAYVDRGIKEVVKALKEEKALEKTILIITSTQAVAGEVGSPRFRQDTLDDASLRVPLVVRVPGLKGRRITEIVETIEIIPSLMTLLGHDQDFSTQGRSFAGLMFGVEDATAPSRYAIAHHLPFVGELPTEARTSVRNARWRLTAGVALSNAKVTDSEAPDATTVNPEVVATLARKMEDMTAFGHACIQSWSVGREEPLDLSESGRLAARASWLAAIRDPRAIDVVRKLIGFGSGDMLTAIRVLLSAGRAEDAPLAQTLLDHPDEEVAALAGAFLILHGDADIGLDYAIAGLRPTIRDEVVATVLESLAESERPRARKAIERYQPRPRARGLAARRDLALARLGSDAAKKRLPQHLLAPHVEFDKRPFLEAIRKSQPEKYEGLLALTLTDGDPADASVALNAIAALEDYRPAYAVAHAIDNLDPSVRSAALSLLRKWGSLAGYRQLLASTRNATEAAVPAAWAMISRSVLIGSPLLPGARFDHIQGRFLTKDGRTVSGLPDIASAPLEVTVTGVDRESELCAFVFWLPEGETPEKLKLRVKINDAFTRTIAVVPVQNLWMWVGATPATRIEAGANRVGLEVSAARGVKLPEVLATAFAFIPPSATTAAPLAAIETLPYLDRLRPPLVTTVEYDADYLAYHVWMTARNAGQDGKADRVIVKLGDEVIFSGALPRPNGRRRIRIPIPTGARHGTPLHLIHEDPSPGVNASIVLMADR